VQVKINLFASRYTYNNSSVYQLPPMIYGNPSTD
jgi:hypothetical protein